MGSVSSAMDSSNASSIFANFGLQLADGSESIARGDGTAALVQAVQAQVDRSRASDAAGTGASAASAQTSSVGMSDESVDPSSEPKSDGAS